MRIVVVGPLAVWLVNFRGEMMRAMVARGHRVLAMAPEDDPAIRATLAAMDVAYAPFPMERTGVGPIADLRTVRSLVSAFRNFGADLVLSYATKPVIYGTIAARLADVPRRAAMITGVGSVLQDGGGIRRQALATVLRTLYSSALRHADVVFFQNPDDERSFRTRGLVGSRSRIVRINGSGVDLRHFSAAPLPPLPVRFLMVGRLIRDKGILEYVEAARLVRRIRPDARFQLLGPLDSNPSAISAGDLDAWRAEGIVEYLGSASDVRPALSAAHVCVLPSYGEGTPRSVLEAMSMGRPVLVTDVPGCRETVEPGGNGLMVPVRDAAALAQGMLALLGDGNDLAAMGRRSRAIAEERFDVHAVNRVILEALELG